MTKTTDGIAFGDELYLPSLAMADQIATDDNKTVQTELDEIKEVTSSIGEVELLIPTERANKTYTVPSLSQYKYLYVEMVWDANMTSYGRTFIPMGVFEQKHTQWLSGFTTSATLINAIVGVTYVSDTSISVSWGGTETRPRCTVYGIK